MVGAPNRTDSQVLDAILTIASDLDLASVLHRIVAVACELTGAHYGALGVVDRAGTALSEFVTHGLTDEQEAIIGPRPTGKGVLGQLLSDPRPLRLERISDHATSFGFPDHHPQMASFLGVPIRVRGLVYGNLYLTDKVGASAFTEHDEQVASSLAAAAGVAIDNARLHERLAELAIFEDRERIARDLHDTVIQRLFAVGLGLQGISRIVDPPEVADRIEAAVDDIDATISDIRATVFALQARDDAGLRTAVTAVVTEARGALGFLPKLQFDGPIDTSVSSQLQEHAVSIVREALSNVARHARATRASVALGVGGGELTIVVSDDGIGVRATSGPTGSGMRNMAGRAQQLGGVLDVKSRPGEGTSITWRVPLEA